MGFLKRAINNLTTLPPPPPQGIAMSRIATIDVTSSVPSVTFSGLNGNSDGIYWLVAYGINLDTAGSIIRAQFNGDTNAAHYATLRVEINNGTTVSGSQNTNEQGIVITDATFNIYPQYAVSLDYRIFPKTLATSGTVTMIGQDAMIKYSPYVATYEASTAGHWFGSGATNLTSITISIRSANLTAGHIELWAPRTV